MVLDHRAFKSLDVCQNQANGSSCSWRHVQHHHVCGLIRIHEWAQYHAGRTPHIRFYNEIKPNPNQPIDQTLEFSESLNIIRSIKPSTSRLAIHDAEKIIQTLQADPRVLGVSPKISSQVFFNVGTIDLTGIVNGIDVEKEAQLFAFTDYITSGDYSELAQTNTIILGKGAADRMLADVGDVIQVTTAQGNRIQLKVVGYYQSGLGDFDNSNSFASLTTVQKMLGESPSYVTDIQVKLKDLDLAPGKRNGENFWH